MRKASLQLSIDAIVVLILAITILGLGLGFIKNQFGGIANQFGQVSEEIQTQMLEKIKQSNDLVTFNTQNFDLSIGKSKPLYMGIRNTGSDDCFYIKFVCIDAITPNGDSVDANNCPGTESENSWNWFNTFKSRVIKAGEIVVLPIKVQTKASGSPIESGTYNGQVIVYKEGTESGDATCQDTIPDTASEHGSQEFFVEVK